MERIREFYDAYPEEDRLLTGLARLEACRTRQLIERHAGKVRATVVDIGGAAGAYALWLSERGCTVHLLDPVQRLVAEARRRSADAAHPIATQIVADARALPYPTEFADIALLLGPLYHLVAAEGRAQALSEAARVLKPGGMLFAAAMSRWAYAFHGLARDLFSDPSFAEVVAISARDGHHRGTTNSSYFTTAYFHRPDKFVDEVARAGFLIEGCYGLEGPSVMLNDFDERWADPRRRADMIYVAELLEAEPSALAISPHLLTVARKPA